jgi:hypothetical protein
MLGGTWLASLTADLGDGVFDGAYLVENFENLNPANTFWDKYYHLYANVDTEPPRFLEFERWWGGFYLMNREEIEWITRNLFVGNKLWSGETRAAGGAAFDLRNIKAPIVLFASMGDNITPPQQAFNWVADVYGSTEEIKARGQVIVGLVHESIGHLGIFVSGKVAKKEHAQIVSVLKSIEALPPGLYGMVIDERKGRDGKIEYDVRFNEYELEDIVARLNRFARADEKPFEAVAAISEFNQRAYELFLQPLIQSTSNEVTAKVRRELHPLRAQRWALSDLNPWLSWLGPAAELVRTQAREDRRRQHRAEARENRFGGAKRLARILSRGPRRDERARLFPDLRERVLALSRREGRGSGKHPEAIVDPRQLPFVQEALASIAEGGYPEALARVACLLERKGEPLLLSRLQVRQELRNDYRELLPAMPDDQWRRVRGEQEIIVRYEPEQALATLPKLLAHRGDRQKLVTLVQRLLADDRVRRAKPTAAQLAMFEDIGETLACLRRRTPRTCRAERRVPARRKANGKAAGKARRKARE